MRRYESVVTSTDLPDVTAMLEEKIAKGRKELEGLLG
jgi:hypothetical protein